MTIEEINNEIEFIKTHPVLTPSMKQEQIAALEAEKRKLSLVESGTISPSEASSMYN